MTDRAILFDLDGVIFDTEHFYTDFWAKQGKTFRPDVKDLEMKIKGRGLKDIFQEFFPDEAIQQKIVGELKIMEKQMTFQYINGAEDFIRMLISRNEKICLVTSSKKDKMHNVFVSRPEIKQYFPLMVTSDDIKHSKPSPDCYLKAVELCCVDVRNCVVFEDSLAGIEAAKRAGMRVIALSTSYPKSDLQGKADMIINDFTQITFKELF